MKYKSNHNIMEVSSKIFMFNRQLKVFYNSIASAHSETGRWVCPWQRCVKDLSVEKRVKCPPTLPRHKHTSNLPRTFYLSELVAKLFDVFGFENNSAFPVNLSRLVFQRIICSQKHSQL